MRILRLVCFFLFAGVAQLTQAGFIFEIANPTGAPVGTTLATLTQGVTYTSDVFVSGTAPNVLNQLTGVNFVLTGTGGNTSLTSFSSTNLFGTPVGSPTGQTFTHLSASGYALPVSNRVKIGELTFVAGTVGTTTNYAFLDPNQAAGVDNMFARVDGAAASSAIDSQIFTTSPIGFSVTAVPEPSSITLLGLAGACIAGFRRSRKLTV